MKTVVVLGGGITGLCTMHYLQRQVQEKNLAVKLVLVEKIHTLVVSFTLHTNKDSSWKLERILL